MTSLVHALSSDGSTLTVTWNAPSDSGGGTVTGYEYRVSTDNGSTFGAWTATSGTDAAGRRHVITVVSGQSYVVEVRAVSDAAHSRGAAARSSPRGAIPSDATVATAAVNSRVSEGSNIAVTVTLDQPAPVGGATVVWYLAAGAGRAGSPEDDLDAVTETTSEDGFDYLTTIAEGNRVATITLGAAADRLVEHTEMIDLVVDRVECSACGDAGSFTPSTDTLTFGVVDATTISLGVSATSPVTEGTPGVGSAPSSTVTVTATASGSAVTLERPVTVKVVTSDGTATAGADYVALDETVSFGSGTVVGTGAVDDPNTPGQASPLATQTVAFGCGAGHGRGGR